MVRKKRIRQSVPVYKDGDLVMSRKDIIYPAAYGSRYSVMEGEIGTVMKVLKNVPIQDLGPYCDDEEYSKLKKSEGYSTVLDVLWLTGEHAGCCIATHKSNVIKIMDFEEIRYPFRKKN